MDGGSLILSHALRVSASPREKIAAQPSSGERPMRTVRIAFAAFSLCFTFATLAQVPTIIKEIDQLESQRDPKCYATANRLEDFIYGTSLDFDARTEKIALQKRLIKDLWLKATDPAKAAGKSQISVDALRPVL